MKNNLKLLLVIAAFALAITSCKKDSVDANDNEVITTVQLQITPVGGGTALTYKWEDLDGPGGTSPVIDRITLATSKTYTVQVMLYDKTKTPPVVTSDEVRKEAVDHRLYFEPSAGANITVTNLDNDPNGIPLGLMSTFTTGSAATGTMKVTLRHYENGGKAAVDLVSSTKSSTDAETTFNTTVK